MVSRASFLVVFSLISLLSVSAESLKKRYDGFQLLKIPLTSASERQFIRDVSDSDDVQLDFWSEGMDMVDILVSPQSLQSFIDQLNLHHIKYTVQSSDIQVDIDNEEKILRATRKEKGRALDYDTFNLYEDIMAELDALVLRCPAGLTCETVVHGVSYEGRDIKGIRVYKAGSESRKVWLDATIHAREWLATAVSLKIISNIVDNYSSDSALAAVVDQYDWYLLPIVNVDGYAFTWTGDRLWRKNRSPNSGAVCLGTDLNRNFEYVWGTSGSSDNPCSSTYHGDSPASELETQAMQARLVEFGSSLVMTINLHTYGRMWLSPWSYETSVGTCYVGPDDQEVFRVANAAANAVEETHNTVWTRGPFCTVLYPGSGTSVDFGKGVGGVKYTFLPELRGNNFIIAATEIQPAFEETWNGVLAALTAIDNSQDYYMD